MSGPTGVIAVFSGVLAKVGAYGFLRVVLPTFPDATIEFQEVVTLDDNASERRDPVHAGVENTLEPALSDEIASR